jgi:DNA-binding transcriptional LysR family regulator
MVPSKNGYPAPVLPSWEDVRLFLAVVDSGSFTGAARQLRIGQPTISRRMATLEEELAEPLFLRGVAGAALTTAGERLLPAARRMAESAGELGRLIAGGESRPEGVVRIAAPPGFAWEFLAPFARHVAKVEPGLRLQILSSVEYLDLARGDADLAIRGRKPNQRDLVWRVGLEVQAAAYATKEYVARLPRRYGMADVGWISWAPPYTQLAPQPQLEAAIPGFRPVFTSDSYLIQRQAAESGVGAMILSKATHPFMPRSALIELDLDLGPEAKGALYLVCARSALAVPRVRAVVALLEAEFRRVESAQLVSAG